MRRAFELEVIAVNPAPAERRVKTTAPKTSLLTVEQVAQLLATATTYRNGRYSALFHVLLLGGLRPSEALALRWDDLHERRLRVERAVTVDAHRRLVAGPTKTKAARSVVLPATALAALEQHRRTVAVEILRVGARREWLAGGRLMFPREDGRFLRIARVRSAWYAILEVAGLPAVRLYDARHSYVSALLHQGVDARTVADLAGHKDPAMTLRRYAHATPASVQNAVERLQAAITAPSKAITA
jgi:integrase